MDVALLEKKTVIEYQMTLVKEKMQKIKKNAIQIQTQITKMLEETLEEMQEIV